jgi:kinetochore protein Nuf2|tara:strand:- start:1912 stop:2220 length:309 start_codon:yes stop_codon:yes gene_type:complete
MANYSFPLLKSGEILLCLHELQIASTEEDLQKPNPLKVQLIYSQFIELLLNQRREDMVQPAFSGIQELEFPELHEESVPTISFLNAWCVCKHTPPAAPLRTP